MKAPLRVPVTGLRPGVISLPKDTSNYVFRVHRVKVGDEVVLFDPEARLEATARVLSESELVAAPPTVPPSRSLPIHLIQAIGKGDKPEQVLRDATVLGAERVTLVHSSRTVAKLDGAGKRQRLVRVMVEAARQCGRAGIPEWEGPLPLPAALARAEGSVRVVCSPTPDAEPLSASIARQSEGASSPSSVDVLIGPEGGFDQGEIAQARGAGFSPVGLGPLVLRTETAATAVLGFLRLSWVDAS